jgi:hypothetical protein
MSTATCKNCGNVLRADAVFCPRCGVPIQDGPDSAVRATLVRPARPPRRVPKKLIAGLVAIVVVAVVVVAVYQYEYRPGGPQNPYLVKVSQVIWTKNGNALSTGPGFTKRAGTNIEIGTTLSCSSFLGFPSTCSTGSVYILTPGFGVVSSNAPASWSSGPSGATFSVQVDISVPDSSYSGTLAIDLH